MTTTAEVRNIVAEVFEQLGVDSYDSRIDKNVWGLTMGSVGGLIGVFENPAEPEMSVINTAFRIMKVPAAKSLPFFRKLLAINGILLGRAAFHVDDENIVWLQSGRPIVDLDFRQVLEIVINTSRMADYYDDVLLDEFGRENALA